MSTAFPEIPEQFSHYTLERRLGEGGFGWVYAAYDSRLDRRVAVKFLRPGRLGLGPDAYLAEARALARLDHPGVVAVYDAGRVESAAGIGLVYFVSSLVEGQNLAELMAAEPPSPDRAARLVAAVARALEHAHAKGLVHRDVKPSNIMVTEAGAPVLIDFGVALPEEDFGQEWANVGGTPEYLSPEQARGEGHLVDRRSDVFSLGVVFYELLSGRPPFAGATLEVVRDIRDDRLVPPSEIVEGIPGELERICLRALARRPVDRYPTAAALAEDLEAYLEAAGDGPAPGGGGGAEGTVGGVRPRGLRAYDSRDAASFLHLLPGPRDRRGVPESVNQWTAWVAAASGAGAVQGGSARVGLIYGPSGGGKSSLVKAGLLPRLGPAIEPVYVEAEAGEDLEASLAAALEARFPSPVAMAGLEEDLRTRLARLRRGDELPRGAVLVLVIDQFEQWLHRRRVGLDDALVDALRQCDGVRLKALLVVRDDFWVDVGHLLDEIEVDLVRGFNLALVDAFEPGHARRVLSAFGQAQGKFPADGEPGAAKRFVARAVGELGAGGKTVPVRLAVFAEMMKDAPWTEEELVRRGGVGGVGEAFLEAAFGNRATDASTRPHATAARAVLAALLPPGDTLIRGARRTQAELLEASGYADRPGRFDELLRLLDGDLRLLTPSGATGEGSPTPAGGPGYQLTHDFLVPVLRRWLGRVRAETARGRAALRLEELAGAWGGGGRDPRHLPSLSEWVRIGALTEQARWTGAERDLMVVASRRHLGRTVSLAALLIMGGLAVRLAFGDVSAGALVTELKIAPAAQIAAWQERAAPYKDALEPRLYRVWAEAPPGSRARFNAAVACLTFGFEERGKQMNEVVLQGVLNGPEGEFAAVIDLWGGASFTGRAGWLERFRPLAATPPGERGDGRDWFRAAWALLSWGEEPPGGPLAAELARSLATFRPGEVGAWAKVLPGRSFAPAVGAELESILAQATAQDQGSPNGGGEGADPAWIAAAAALTLAHLEGSEGLLGLMGDPTDRARLALAVEFAAEGAIDPRWLVGSLGEPPLPPLPPELERSLLLALGSLDPVNLAPPGLKAEALRELRSRLTSPDPGVHAAARWALGRQGATRVTAPSGAGVPRLAHGEEPPPVARWFNSHLGLPFSVIEVPAGGGGNPEARRVALAMLEIEQSFFDRTFTGRTPPAAYAGLGLPVSNTSARLAMQFCNDLSLKEGLEPCYEGTGEEGRLVPRPGYLDLTGYRLPTGEEWQIACRAGSPTELHFGRLVLKPPSEGPARCWLLDAYARYHGNTDRQPGPVGRTKPNRLGFFDILGNASEWSMEGLHPSGRGGSYAIPATSLDARESLPRPSFLNTPGRGMTIRPARTLPRPERPVPAGEGEPGPPPRKKSTAGCNERGESVHP